MHLPAPPEPHRTAMAARLRALLARRLVVLGRRRGNPLARMAAAIGRGPARKPARRASARPRIRPAPGFSELTCRVRLALLGLGIAGGGGGSPGAPAPQPI